MNNHFNIFDLTSFVTNDLSEEKKREIKKHIETCVECRKKIDNLVQQKTEFLNKFPNPPQTKIKKENIIHTPKSYWQKSFAIAALFLISLTTTIIYYNQNSGSSGHLGQLAYGIKGDMAATIVVQNNDNTIEERANHIYHPQEKIQIKYSSAAYLNLISLSIDSAGNIYQYCPDNSDSSFIIEKGANIPLPNSITLDDYLGTELFIIVFSKHRTSVEQIKSAIKEEFNKTNNIENLNFDPGKDFYISKILIRKELPSK